MDGRPRVGTAASVEVVRDVVEPEAPRLLRVARALEARVRQQRPLRPHVCREIDLFARDHARLLDRRSRSGRRAARAECMPGRW